MIGGGSPLQTLLEGTVSQRQLHETLPGLEVFPVRACGVEARDAPQHRTQVKPRKADLLWVSVPPNATPDIQSRQVGSEAGSGGTLRVLTRGDLHGSARCGRRLGDVSLMSVEKSDHSIVVVKRPLIT